MNPDSESRKGLAGSPLRFQFALELSGQFWEGHPSLSGSSPSPIFLKAAVNASKGIRNHLCIVDDGHEIRIACPTRDHVDVKVPRDTGPPDFSYIKPDIESSRPINLAEGCHGSIEQPKEVKPLVIFQSLEA